MVKLVFSNFTSSFLFQLRITVSCAIAQLLFDADKLVVLSHTVGTAHRTCLNLTEFVATAISAIVVSSVSPERWEVTVV